MNNSTGANVMAVARIPLVSTNCGYLQASLSPEEELFKLQQQQAPSQLNHLNHFSSHSHIHIQSQSQQAQKKSLKSQLPVGGFYLAGQQKQRANSQVPACHNQTSASKEQTSAKLQVNSAAQSQPVSSYQLQYQEEFNRMRERLFRLLSKVPIQVETGQSAASCSSSGARKKADLEPLIIKYYNDRSLADILDQHFGCALMKHNFERGAPLNAHLSASQVLKLNQSSDSHEFSTDTQQQLDSQISLAGQPNTCFQDFSLNNQADSNQQITDNEAYALKCPSSADQCCLEWQTSGASGNFSWQAAYNLAGEPSIEQKPLAASRSLAVKEDKFGRLAPHHRPARNPKGAAGRASGNRGLRAAAGSPSREQLAAVYGPGAVCGQDEQAKGLKYEPFGHPQHFAPEVQYPNAQLYNTYQPAGELGVEPQLVLTFNQPAMGDTCQRTADANQQLYSQLDHYYQQPSGYSGAPTDGAQLDHWQVCQQQSDQQQQQQQQQFSHNMIEPIEIGSQQNHERAFYLAGEQNGYVVYADSQANLQLQLQVDAASQQSFNELANT